MNLASVITLLQLVLAILSNPNMTQSPAAQSLALQAVNLATQALQVSQVATTTPISLPPPQPPLTIVDNATSGIGGPSDIILPPTPITPSCSVVATVTTSTRVSVSWTTQGVDPATPAELYHLVGNNSGQPIYGLAGHLIFSPYPDNVTDIYKLKVGGATCLTFFPNATSALDPVKVGDVSTPNPPSWFSSY